MPRSVRESDEETEARLGRRTRGHAGPTVVDSPLRRSTRVRLHVKQNESSPESPVSDTSNASTTRITRRRAGTMDSVSGPEKQRTLRSRKSSMSSDVSEVIDVETAPGTPTKKTKNVLASKRLIRAGSEAKSPPPITRVTRRTRASSVGLEEIDGNKAVEKAHSGTTDTPVKTRRRASVLPSEATVVEEKETTDKVLIVELDRSLPEISEDNETESKITPNSPLKKGTPTPLKKKSNTSRNSIHDTTTEEDNTFVKGQHENPVGNISSETSENITHDVSISDTKTISYSDPKSLELSANSGSDANFTLIDRSIESTSPRKNITLDTENSLNDSIVERQKSFNNKENETGNIIGDTIAERNTETVLNVLAQSPKPISASPVFTNKLLKEKYKSVANESSIMKRRHSKDILDVVTETASPLTQTATISKPANEGIALILNASTDSQKEENVDHTKEAVNIEINSLETAEYNKNPDKSTLPVELDTSTNLLNNSTSCDEVAKSMEVDCNEKETMDITNSENESLNNDRENKMDISVSEVSDITDIHKNEENVPVSQSITTAESDEKKEETEKRDISETVKGNETVDATDKFPSINLIETAVDSSDASLISNIQSSVLPVDEHGEKDFVDGDQSNKSSHICATAVSDSSDVSVNRDKSKDDVEGTIKSSQSSIIAECPAEPNEELSSKVELPEKTSVQDTSLTSRRKSVNKLAPEDNEQKSEVGQEIHTRSEENMEVDENDSDVSAANLFQDIPANEWNDKSVEKQADSDNSSVHSMSTEKLEPESEAECDLVLVDQEAWLAAEKLKAAKKSELFDYDSDDTVVLKSHLDSLKAQNEERKALETVQETAEKTTHGEEVLTAKTSARKSLQRRSDALVEKNTENEMDDDEATETVKSGNDSLKKSKNSDEPGEQSTQSLNTSSRKKSVEQKLNKTREMEDDTVESCSNSKLNTSKSSKRDSIKKKKSLNKSVCNADFESSNDSAFNASNTKQRKNESNNEPEEEETPKGERLKKRKSLNKSQTKVNDADENVNLNTRNADSSAKKVDKNQFLNSLLEKQILSTRANVESICDSDNESKESEVDGRNNRMRKKKFGRNCSTVVHTGSDSDDNRNNIDSDESCTGSTTLPTFLFRTSDSDNSNYENNKSSNESIDSDIQREYNLDGKTPCKFSDDDVPGDECRASESESSDPDDDGSDLKDFVVDDDEVEETEIESNEEIEVAEAKVVEADQEQEKIESEDEIDVVGDEEGTEGGEKDESEEEMEVEDDKEEAEDNEKEEDTNVEVDDESDMSDEDATNKSLKANKKVKAKAENASNLSIQGTAENEKKKSKRNRSRSNGNEMESSLSNLSLSNSLKAKKANQKGKDTNDLIEDIPRQELNDSGMKFHNRIKKLNKSMECSTPKSTSSKREKFETSLQTFDVTIDTTHRRSGNQANELVEETSIKGKKGMDMSLRGEKSLKKLKKLEEKEAKLLHKSLPTDLIELVERTNLSRPMSSKLMELNRTMITPTTETPTSKYLKKDKLNDSAPIIQLTNEHTKLMQRNLENLQTGLLSKSENEEPMLEDPSDIAKHEDNESLKRKLYKVADSILNIDRQKKGKKRKRRSVETTNSSLLEEGDSQANVAMHVSKKKQNQTSPTVIVDTNNSGETCESTGKKKKKKKKKAQAEFEKESMKVEMTPPLPRKEVFENCDEPVQEKKKKKKKKKENNKDQDLSEWTTKAVENHAPVNKKLKAGKAISPQIEEVPVKKSLKKNKLTKDIPLKVQPGPVKASKLVKSNDAVVDSDEAPREIAFVKARNEALSVLKRTADNIKVAKEIKKKQQREHLEKIQKEKEAKVRKIDSKRQLNPVTNPTAPSKGIKRISDDILENLSDLPSKPSKRRKLTQKEELVLPSRSMSNCRWYGVQNVDVEENYTELSSCGGTIKFGVVNLKKIKKQRRVTRESSYRQKMLARNSRQPVSAYLMYLEKQKAAGKDKFCYKPF